MCTRGHAFIRTYDAGSWYLACAYPDCGHRLLEGSVERPVAEVVELELPTDPIPQDQEVVA